MKTKQHSQFVIDTHEKGIELMESLLKIEKEIGESKNPMPEIGADFLIIIGIVIIGLNFKKIMSFLIKLAWKELRKEPKEVKIKKS